MRHTHTKLARRTALAAVAHGASFLPFILWFIAAKRLGPESFGLLSYALSFASLFDILHDLGLRDHTVSELARDHAWMRRVGALLPWRWMLSALAAVATLVCFELTGPTSEARVLVWVMAPMVALRSSKNYLRGLLQAVGRFGLDATVTIADRVVMVAAGLLALALRGSAVAVAVALLLARILDTLWSVWAVRKSTGLRFAWGPRDAWKIQRAALPLGAFAMIVTAYAYADQIMIALLRGTTEVGLYTACYKIHEGFSMVPAILSAPVLPALAFLTGEHPGKAADLAARSVKYALCSGLALSIGLVLGASPLLELLYGAAYLSAAPALVVLGIATTFTFVLWMLNQALIATARRAAMVKVATIGLVLNLTLNLVMIPRYGFVGAAWATLVAEGASLWMAGRAASSALPGMRLPVVCIRPLAAASLTIGIGWIARYHVPPLLAAGGGVVVFAILLILSGAMDHADRAAFRSLFRPSAPAHPEGSSSSSPEAPPIHPRR